MAHLCCYASFTQDIREIAGREIAAVAGAPSQRRIQPLRYLEGHRSCEAISLFSSSRYPEGYRPQRKILLLAYRQIATPPSCSSCLLVVPTAGARDDGCFVLAIPSFRHRDTLKSTGPAKRYPPLFVIASFRSDTQRASCLPVEQSGRSPRPLLVVLTYL